jgi:hypothetical protein
MKPARLALFIIVVLEVVTVSLLVMNLTSLTSSILTGMIVGRMSHTNILDAPSDVVFNTDHCTVAEPLAKRLIPNCSCVVDFGSSPIPSFTIIVNSAGFRDHEYPIDHQAYTGYCF